jgi:nucleoside 2-deoxyribosyltransferase
MKSFLICPVRGMSPDAHASTVSQLEAQGFTVHWPPRDTDQNDDVGLRICRDNANAIAAADVVHIIWDGKSQGCLFDLGVAFALKKKLEIIIVPAPTEGKSFQNMMAAWACDGVGVSDMTKVGKSK